MLTRRLSIVALPFVLLACPVTGQVAMAESEPARVWSILEIAGTTATGDAHLAMVPDGHAFGSSGCNRFQTTVTQSGSVLSFGPIAATRMACPGALAAQESTLFELFAQQLAVTYDVLRDQLTLTASSGAILILQRSE
jgi:heat shock protein HslJ